MKTYYRVDCDCGLDIPHSLRSLHLGMDPRIAGKYRPWLMDSLSLKRIRVCRMEGIRYIRVDLRQIEFTDSYMNPMHMTYCSA